MTANYTEPLAKLRATAEQLRAEHDKFCGWDGRLYNGGTAIVLMCNVAAAVFPPASTGWVLWLPKVLLGIATFGIALERAKNYGLRWKFHIERKNQYGSIIDRIDLFDAWPNADKEARLKELMEDFHRVRSGEGDIPGTDIRPTRLTF